MVNVPVLSKTIVSTSAKRSIESALLSKTPARKSAPLATTCTVGTARARAQGQVIMSTQIAVIKASWKLEPFANQKSAVDKAAI